MNIETAVLGAMPRMGMSSDHPLMADGGGSIYCLACKSEMCSEKGDLRKTYKLSTIAQFRLESKKP